MKKGVIFTPGDIFSIDDRCKSTLRLGLSRLNLNQIEEGIKIIGEVKKKIRKVTYFYLVIGGSKTYSYFLKICFAKLQ